MRNNIAVREILVSAIPGSDLHSCVWDCIELSIKESRKVKLCHNEKHYLIDPFAIVDGVLERHRL